MKHRYKNYLQVPAFANDVGFASANESIQRCFCAFTGAIYVLLKSAMSGVTGLEFSCAKRKKSYPGKCLQKSRSQSSSQGGIYFPPSAPWPMAVNRLQNKQDKTGTISQSMEEYNIPTQFQLPTPVVILCRKAEDYQVKTENGACMN